MARKPRIEYPGAFFHIIARGNNREDIFRDNEDRQHYLEHLSSYINMGKVTLYAFCLMTNHIHLLVEMGEVPISRVLQRLHTWYTRYYNQKYNRVGHVFQGRYKSVLCEKDAYLVELVRYIHLNPVRAGITMSPRDYRWSSHRAYLGEDEYSFLNISTDLVLFQFANNLLHARNIYEEFVMGKVGEGWREDLYKVTDQRILGGTEFIAHVMDLYRIQRTKPPVRRLCFDLSALQGAVERELNMDKGSMLRLKRPGVLARRIFCYVARELLGFKNKELAEYLGKDMATVTQGVRYVSQALDKKQHVRQKVERIISIIEGEQATYQERLKKLKDFFSQEQKKISLAYLFGSAAKDKMGPMSDVDIAVLYKDEFHWDHHFELTHQLQELLQFKKVDLIALNRVAVELAYTCIKEGVLIYSVNQATRVEFEAKILGLYGDFLPILERQKMEVLKSGYERGTRRYHEALGKTERVLREIRAFS